ncbi:hypothetical protein PQ472_11030 [Lacticaseibacillus pabuli]|uniref:Uncharacterized protein n=1 Tax=Lacticaseibacillus pabuli TaxID=3025672 RepID=A0ABY7WQE5_9LACO|nr:hypothetical protein [Lacticaseibacillus sp. KACC 23028]WDF82409.1 hypothetical protein PQ472_11030 [Lacticaseibacillus sp. KACC 23028]
MSSKTYLVNHAPQATPERADYIGHQWLRKGLFGTDWDSKKVQSGDIDPTEFIAAVKAAHPDYAQQITADIGHMANIKAGDLITIRVDDTYYAGQVVTRGSSVWHHATTDEMTSIQTFAYAYVDGFYKIAAANAMPDIFQKENKNNINVIKSDHHFAQEQYDEAFKTEKELYLP